MENKKNEAAVQLAKQKHIKSPLTREQALRMNSIRWGKKEKTSAQNQQEPQQG